MLGFRKPLPLKPTTFRVVRVYADTDPKPSDTSVTPASPGMPEIVTKVTDFLTSTDFDYKNTEIYEKYLKKYVETKEFELCIGWNYCPELLNGRVAMLGALSDIVCEIFGQGSLLKQWAAG